MIDHKLLDQATRNVRTDLEREGDPSFHDVERAIKLRHPWPMKLRALLYRILSEYRMLVATRTIELFTEVQ